MEHLSALQIIGIGWGVLGLISSLVFGVVVIFTMEDPKMGKTAFTCFLLLFFGLLSALFTGSMIFYTVRLAKAQAWWKAIGTQKQAQLLNIKLFDYMRSGQNVSETSIVLLYQKHRKTVLPVTVEAKPAPASA